MHYYQNAIYWYAILNHIDNLTIEFNLPRKAQKTEFWTLYFDDPFVLIYMVGLGKYHDDTD